MNCQYTESVDQDEERLDVAAASAGRMAAPRRPVDEPAENALNIAEQPTSARRYGLLATELGFRLIDVCMVALAADVAGDAGTGAPIRWLPLCVALLVTNIVFSVRGIYRDAPVFLRNLCIERCMMAWWHAFGCWLVVMLLIDAGLDFAQVDMVQMEMAHPDMALLDVRAAGLAMSFHPRTITLFLFCGMVFIAAGRLALIQVFALTPVGAHVRQRTYIIGAGSIGESLAEHFARADDPEMQVLGFFDDGAPARQLRAWVDCPGSVESIRWSSGSTAGRSMWCW
jgi:hypothetical protein